MAYDRWNSTYGSPPSGVSREQAASEDAARRFARRRALLMGLQGGLGAGVEAGGGFLRNLTRGLAGSLGGTLQASQMQHEEERQAIRDAVEMRRDEEARRRWDAMFGLQSRGVELQERRENRLMAPGPEPDYGILPPEAVGPESPGQVRAPVGLPRGGYKTFAETMGREKAQALFPKPEKPTNDRPKLGDLNTFSDNFRLDKDVQNYTVVRDNYKRIEDSARLGSGQGDLAIIFSFMRVLDPESVVRETEFKNAAQAVGRLQQMTNIPSQWIKGNRLTPEGRAGFRKAAKQIHDTQRKTYETKAALYRRQAQQYGVDPSLIIPDYRDVEDAARSGDPLDDFYD